MQLRFSMKFHGRAKASRITPAASSRGYYVLTWVAALARTVNVDQHIAVGATSFFLFELFFYKAELVLKFGFDTSLICFECD
jgi:hypothetical protein